MAVVRARLKSYIQPFERELALKELTELARAEPTLLDDNWYAVDTTTSPELLAEHLSYWEIISDPGEIYTRQSLVEATTNVVRNGVPLERIAALLPFKSKPPLVNRRALRYASHGIHEYRGKFFPQLVRSLINIAGVPQRGTVLDPMCGSGTTLVEAVLSGRTAYGVDLNPLSVLISNTKCGILTTDPKELAACYDVVRSQLLGRGTDELSYFAMLPERDREYLSAWFADYVLLDLDRIMRTILDIENAIIRDFFRVVLSNILRSVSWQKDADLRVRKEVRYDVEIDVIRTFLEELGRSVRLVLAALYQRAGASTGSYEVLTGDARDAVQIFSDQAGSVDVIITSPPYATALPYLDTDRLSLSYLGLLSRAEHRARDAEMIGNREVTERLRRGYWARFEAEGQALGSAVLSLVRRIHDLNRGSAAGFRRRNLPALLAKYFFDMKEVLTGMHDLLKPEGRAFVVIGDNHTVAGGQRVDIPTTSLLASLAQQVGFRLEGMLPMEMLVSRDIFKKNAVAAENILLLRRP